MAPGGGEWGRVSVSHTLTRSPSLRQVRTTTTTIVTNLAATREVGKMLGLSDIALSVARMAAPTASGVLMHSLGPAAPLVACAAAAAVAAAASSLRAGGAAAAAAAAAHRKVQ